MRSEQHSIYSKDANFIDISLKYEANRRIHTNSSSVTHRDKLHCGGPTFNPLTAISAVILFTISIFIYVLKNCQEWWLLLSAQLLTFLSISWQRVQNECQFLEEHFSENAALHQGETIGVI